MKPIRKAVREMRKLQKINDDLKEQSEETKEKNLGQIDSLQKESKPQDA